MDNAQILDSYKSIAAPSEGLFKDNGSRFIARAYPVETEEEVKDIVAALKKEYYDARHHCYAYILGPDKATYRANDDGEPSGTAGRPIHGQLLSKDITNTLVIVVRYFGGIKLGVSGLINAYKTATKDALDNAEVVEKTVNEIYRVEFEYPLMNDVMRLLKDEGLEQFNQRFEMNCSLDFAVRKSRSTRVTDAFDKIRGVTLTLMHTE